VLQSLWLQLLAHGVVVTQSAGYQLLHLHLLLHLHGVVVGCQLLARAQALSCKQAHAAQAA
jgi:hypothetical protein